MNEKELVVYLWDEMGKQNWDNVRLCFADNATIRWHNSNEAFSVKEFILINSRYPGNWQISIKRLEQCGDVVISVVLAKSLDNDASAYATSFFNIEHGKITCLNEYWGDNGNPSQWRLDMKVGKPIE